ncbi:hypothetical protein N9P07_02395 [Alphaproteobacteria bacterium]|jgi:hypothetical protein|nr:hypothetical protein [Alphaproteobacteria bacterium]MDA9190267.1 hypothetical protein [Alphaproteobacteria bacterium]MDC3311542.1 hypothetical protein [Alphaproteobacteria bacterium]
MQNQIQGMIIPSNLEKKSREQQDIGYQEIGEMGIEFVTFDDDDNQVTSTKVPLAPFFFPWKQSEQMFI